jgi:NADP-dependent 3-hydroxy acid dehydrogenase YdfG
LCARLRREIDRARAVSEATTKRTAAVTGASSGLGAATACALAALGWRVAIGARRADRLAQVAAEITAAGGEPFVHPLDVTDAASVDAFFAAAESAFGTIGVVVSNAGISIPGLLHETTPENLTKEVATNLLGAMFVARRAIQGMLASDGATVRAKGADLVFISSDNVRAPRPYQVGYSASKSGVESLAQTLRMELEGTGIRTTIVRPGPAASEFGWDWDQALLARILESWQRLGLQRHLEFMPAEAVANAVVTAVTAPRGVQLDIIQIHPEPPIETED